MYKAQATWSPLKSRRDRSGKRWNFSYWNALPWSSLRAQRLFFWDDLREEVGVVVFFGGSTRPYPQIEHLAERLVKFPEVRKQYRTELLFPFERHYAEFGTLPEEAAYKLLFEADEHNEKNFKI